MKQNASRTDKIDNIRSSQAILMIQTRALCEVLRVYFEDKIGDGEVIDISASTLVSFLYQVDDNLERMEELVRKMIEEGREEPVKLRVAVG